MMGRSEKGETAQPNYMEVLLTLSNDIEDLEQLTNELNERLEKKFEICTICSYTTYCYRELKSY